MDCAGSCLGGRATHRLEPSVPLVSSIPLHRACSCKVAEIRAACSWSLVEGSFLKCSALWRGRNTAVPIKRSFFMAEAAASQEAATLVVQEVDFTWKGEASQVLLTGDFLNWETKLSLEKGADGVFHVKQKLPPGNYLYKFIVDGQWQHSSDDPTAPDGAGGFNNLINVSDLADLKETASKDSAVDLDSKDVASTSKTSSGVAGADKTDEEASRPKVVAAPVVEVKAAAGKAVRGKAAKKVVEKPLSTLMSEDVLPVLKSALEKEDAVSDVEILFEDNQIQGSFAKNGVPYSFWAYFPDGKLEGSRGFSLSSHGVPPSTVEPFLVDEKKITAELVVFWIRKRLFAQKLLSLN